VKMSRSSCIAGGLARDGFRSRLDLAFSRDQAKRVYVQHKRLDSGADVWRWLDDGGHFYVCGDASRMASDVDAALTTPEIVKLPLPEDAKVLATRGVCRETLQYQPGPSETKRVMGVFQSLLAPGLNHPHPKQKLGACE